MNSANPSTTLAASPQNKQMLLKEIGAKWSKFSDQELDALKSKDDLISQVAAKYSLDTAEVRRDVDVIMNGH